MQTTIPCSIISSITIEMEALIFRNKELELCKVNKPKIENDDDVLIKVAYAGICGTDLHILHGEFPCKEEGDLILGHEMSGTVVDVGKNVKTIKSGYRVSVDPNNGCHKCIFCHLGQPHHCETGGLSNTIGIYRNGGWAQYVCVPEEQIHVLPETISLKQATLCEPMSCLVHGVDRIYPIHIGQNILIMGAGIIGNLWVSTLHHQGHRNVVVVEPNLKRLEYLKKLDTSFKLLTPDMLNKNQTDEGLYDLVIDCSGNPKAIEQGFSLLKNGGKLCIFGVANPAHKVNISPYDIFDKELTIVGVNINPFSFPKSIGMISAMGDRYIDYEKLGIKVYKLQEFEAAMEELKQGSIAKAVFEIK